MKPDSCTHAIAAALWRYAEKIREYERAHEPRENDRLAQRRAGQRVAAREIAEWVEARAREYEEQDDGH